METIEELQEKIKILENRIHNLCLDWAEDDTAIKNFAKKFGIDIEGDSYGVPCMVDVVEEMAKMLELSETHQEFLFKQIDSYQKIISLLQDDKDILWKKINKYEKALKWIAEHGWNHNGTVGDNSLLSYDCHCVAAQALNNNE
jgi:DNA repair exonuclease SbcCD ATPase subunit